MDFFLLVFPFVGLVVGLFGTLIGAGGGFLLVPILLFLLPQASADRITALSLISVFFNALSGTIAYARMGNIHYRSGIQFSLAGLPGAFLGALASHSISRLWFDRVFGIVMVAIAIFLLWRTKWNLPQSRMQDFVLSPKNQRQGIILSIGVGFVSSILGIGGGIIHVPALIYVLGFPVHMATATSHFVLACTSAIAVGEKVWQNSYSGLGLSVLLIPLGAIIGAQIGARLSLRIHGKGIIIGLAIALVIAGARIALKTF